MAYPPTIPPATRANTTAQLDLHPQDHNQLATALNNMPWGRVAGATSSAATTGIAQTQTDVPGCTVTFTKVAGRRYRITGLIGVQGSAAGQVVYNRICDGSNAQLGIGWQTPGTGFANIAAVVEIPPGSAGSVTYKLRTDANAATFQLNTLNGFVHSITVDDIGS